jgi:hypothetical protein
MFSILLNKIQVIQVVEVGSLDGISEKLDYQLQITPDHPSYEGFQRLANVLRQNAYWSTEEKKLFLEQLEQKSMSLSEGSD